MIDEYNLDYHDVFYTEKYCLEDFELMWQNLDKKSVMKMWSNIMQDDEAKRRNK